MLWHLKALTQKFHGRYIQASSLYQGKVEGKRGFVVNTPLRCSSMARILNGSHSFTCTPRVHLLMEWTIPAFAFPAEAGSHLSTQKGWKAELTLGGWLHAEISVRHRELNPDIVTHPSTNRDRRRLTLLIETNSLPLRQTATSRLLGQCRGHSSRS